MIFSKLHHILAIAAFAALGAGCALEGGSEQSGETSAESQADLIKATPAKGGNPVALREESPSNNTTNVQKPPAVLHIKKTEHVIGGGGETDDGPRPHPWEPTPESESTPTDDGNAGGGTGSSPTK